MQKNEERLTDMVKMRLSGYTYQEIADKYSVSRQYVQQAIARFTGRPRVVKKTALDICIYPNLKKWMIDNNIPLIKLAQICGLAGSNSVIIRKKLLGERDFKLTEIKKILEKSGENFEYMFKEMEDAQ